jgi:LAO/AO transport system ATPase
VHHGDRRALARAITLIESGRADHRRDPPPWPCWPITLARQRAAGAAHRAVGHAGRGQIDLHRKLGHDADRRGLRVAVLAVDPSSTRSGGSILGDKTRMDRLSREPRPLSAPRPARPIWAAWRAARARRSRCARRRGFDVVLIETVGVGQSETMVAEMTDLFVLLLAPAGGDELQGVKRGIMEVADLILVNKADGDLKPAATATCADYAGALRLLRRARGSRRLSQGADRLGGRDRAGRGLGRDRDPCRLAPGERALGRAPGRAGPRLVRSRPRAPPKPFWPISGRPDPAAPGRGAAENACDRPRWRGTPVTGKDGAPWTRS